MKFARLGNPGEEIPTVIHDGEHFDLRPLTADITGAFLASDPVARVRRALDAGELEAVADAGARRIGAPIARPGAVICVGMNYAAHAAESGAEPPVSPIIFLKTPNTVTGPNDTVEIPPRSRRTDWEVELGVVIGERAAYLASPDESRRHIAGFVAANDLSEREFQLDESGGQWSKGKCAPGFTPTGPWLVTPEDLDDRDLALTSFVNGEPRQASTTADMIFDVDYLIWHLSQYLTFEPGDLLLTGTPQGVALSGKFPYLTAGDVCELEIEGLGRQRQLFAAYGERSAA
jgi:2-keto-4-pentenoate hydratase/2-oxohepta-3-ene-1,7-dioic acid hydratase in catechol pathway